MLDNKLSHNNKLSHFSSTVITAKSDNLSRWPCLACSKCNVTVWHPFVRPSVRLSVCFVFFLTLIGRAAHTQRDSSASSTRRGQRTFPSEYYGDGRTCYRGGAVDIWPLMIRRNWLRTLFGLMSLTGEWCRRCRHRLDVWIRPADGDQHDSEDGRH